MRIGVDIGYSAVKIVAGNRRATFPSVVGSPDRARWALNQQDAILLTMPDGNKVLVGDGAIAQSQFLNRREDRHWIQSPEYHALMLAAFTEITSASRVDLDIVTGLPIAFFLGDMETVQERFLGTHKVTREGRHAQVFQVNSCTVIPQPFGTLFAVAMDNQGRPVEMKYHGNVGIIDIGGKTTNILSVKRLGEIGHETASINAGTWNVVRQLKSWLSNHYPDLDLRDHEIIEAITSRQIKYYGDPVDLTDIVKESLEHMASEIIAEGTQLWNGAARLDAVLVTGGGAHLLGAYIERHFRATIVNEPVWANAVGYWKLSQRHNIGG